MPPGGGRIRQPRALCFAPRLPPTAIRSSVRHHVRELTRYGCRARDFGCQRAWPRLTSKASQPPCRHSCAAGRPCLPAACRRSSNAEPTASPMRNGAPWMSRNAVWSMASGMSVAKRKRQNSTAGHGKRDPGTEPARIPANATHIRLVMIGTSRRSRAQPARPADRAAATARNSHSPATPITAHSPDSTGPRNSACRRDCTSGE